MSFLAENCKRRPKERNGFNLNARLLVLRLPKPNIPPSRFGRISPRPKRKSKRPAPRLRTTNVGTKPYIYARRFTSATPALCVRRLSAKFSLFKKRGTT